ncbi:putative zinc finger protein 840 [Camelus dromedarius]|uniref:Putative zinc finger protein 840 n=1 Tax=Camelus dromedarius TaxID=9838 RepID=A0A5N4CVT9_CAMDR|nr:putative zinc finger protein 840 [Camelus dromedarius]
MKACTQIKYKLLFQESVKFRDVAVVFSPDQWVHLSPEERQLYMDVMLDNCDYLVSLGHWTYKAEVISSLKRGKEPWMVGREMTSAPCPACQPALENYYALSESVNAFRQSSHHEKHRKLCTFVQHHECDDCSMAFSCISQLTRHQRIHKVEKAQRYDENAKGFRHHSSFTTLPRIYIPEKHLE